MNRPKSNALLFSCTPLLFAAAASAQWATFQPIPDTAYALDMSPDGRFIVGEQDLDGDGFPDGPYLLDRANGNLMIMSLPSPGIAATAVSDDGSVVLGCMPNIPDGQNNEVAGIWTAANGWQSLGYLPDALSCPSRSNGYELSGDGTIAVGLSWDGCSGRGFWWSQATGMLELEPLANGGNRASVVSSDGTVIGGFAQGSSNRTPAMWDGVTTDGMLLDPPSGNIVGEVQGISDDGTILLGNWAGDAYRYTEKGGVEILGQGSIAPSWTGIATDIANSGTIVGFDVLQQARRAWIQPGGEGDLLALKQWVIDHGGTVPANYQLGICTRISVDGRSIIGHDFFAGAWLITICFGDTNGDGVVNVTDLVNVINAWGTDGQGDGFDADLNDDGEVNVLDLIQVISEWGDCQ